MSLFSNTPKKDNGEENKATEAAQPRTGGGLFANANTGAGTGGGLFGGAHPPLAEAPRTGGGLFGNQGGTGLGGGGLFANANTSAGTVGRLFGEAQPPLAEVPRAGGGLFGNKGGAGLGGGGGAGGLFANTGTTGAGTGGGLFGGARPAQAESPTRGGLFGGNNRAAAQGGQQQAEVLNVHELRGNVPYNPNPTAYATNKQGTVNYNLQFTRNRENIDLYSITCANNADPNKSIEELRAEDYELIKRGELPEQLQLKLIENREKLEKGLGFALPVPTASNKSYTKLFKSQTRNSNMKSTFLSNKYSDVIFKVENEDIPAHRNVLGICSSYFDDLFSKHQSDKLPLVIEIPNAKPEAFKALLEFIYCGEVNLYEELAADLLNLCPRFEIKDLADGCEDFLNKMINVDNYLKVLEISDRVSSKPLRKKVFTFMVRNMKTISKREDFEELPRPLLMELLENAVSA